MIGMSYLNVIERYHEYKDALRELLASILTGIAEEKLLTDSECQAATVRSVALMFPFVDMLYTLDPEGVQLSANTAAQAKHRWAGRGIGRDRRRRPYYLMAKESEDAVITEPYLSSAGGLLCLTAAIRVSDKEGNLGGYIVLDIDLTKAIEFLMGDAPRRRFLPVFKAIYVVIVLGLLGVSGVLLYAALDEFILMFQHGATPETLHLKPFGVIIFLTLALAVFDLGKTVLEEEVLMHKDIFRHSSTRRTITRFIAAILIAVSIESLLLMFKAALGLGEDVLSAVWMMLAAVGLLVGLGCYVYLGAKAEVMLLNLRK